MIQSGEAARTVRRFFDAYLNQRNIENTLDCLTEGIHWVGTGKSEMVYGRSQAMLAGLARFLAKNGLETALFRAHLDIYLRTLRRDRGRLRAAMAMGGRVADTITNGVRFSRLCAKQKLYFLVLRALPCLSYFLP